VVVADRPRERNTDMPTILNHGCDKFEPSARDLGR
jgi:hypothetical protein